MPRYDFKALKERSASNRVSKFRTLEPELGVRYKVWIPFEDFLYKRVHYDIKKRTPFKDTRFDTMDCLNQEYGQKGKGCPICEYTEVLWTEWKTADKTKDEKKKKQIQNNINQIVAEYFYLNAINLSDPDKKFILIKLTKAKMLDMQTKAEEHKCHVSDIIWRYKKSDKGGKIEYELIDDLAEEETSKLKKSLETLKSREYDDGGPIDLDQMDSQRKRTSAEFKELLGETSGDDGDSESGSSSRDEKDLSEVEEDSEQLSIDDIAETDSSKTDKAKNASKTVKNEKEDAPLEEESMSLGDLDEDQPEALELEDEPEKNIKVTAADFAAKFKAKDNNYCIVVYRFLLDSKKVKEVQGYKDMAQTAYDWLKKNKEIEIPEKKFSIDMDVAV